MRFVAVTRNTIPAAAARRSAKYSARWPPRACFTATAAASTPIAQITKPEKEPSRSRTAAPATMLSGRSLSAKRTAAVMPAPAKQPTAVTAPAGSFQLSGSSTAASTQTTAAGEQDEQRREGVPVDRGRGDLRERHSNGSRRFAERGGAIRLAEAAVGDRRRPGRQHEQAGHERHEHRQLDGPQVARVARHRAPGALVEHCRDQPQHVHRRQHDRDRADDGPAPAGVEDAGEDEELARERRRSRNGERDHARSP